MSDLDLQDDDAVLRDRLGRLASSAARSAPPAVAPERIRHRGTARRNRRTTSGVVSAGLAVFAVAGVVSGTSTLRGAPLQPAAPTPTVSATSLPSPTTTPGPTPSTSTSTSTSTPATTPATTTRTRTVTVTRSATATAVPAPTAQVADPWDRQGTEFGVLTAASTTAGGGLTIRYVPRAFDNGNWGPEQPARTATVVPGAYLSGAVFLMPDETHPADGRRLTPDQFATAARAALAKGGLIGVWVFHATTDLTSPVTGVQEQYRP